jgi:lipid II:glycine glycyltransferase (peptidoglycan interpeptide bridge formation enzyme)
MHKNVSSLVKENKATYLLLKIVEPDLIADLDKNQLHVEHGFVKNILDISVGEDKLFRKIIPANTRNQIRKGLSNNPVIRFGREELFDDFYNIIAITQTDLGTPVHAISFYRNILTIQADSRLAVIYLDGVAVSVALILFANNTIYHPHTGTWNKYKHTGVNSLLYWEIIKFGIQNSCEMFDMGRSQKGSSGARYKKSWGGHEIQLFYAYCLKEGQSPPKYDTKLMHYLTSE